MLYTLQNRNLRQTLGLLESSLDDMDKANRRNRRRHRLVSVKRGDDETMRVSYAPNGNILFKTGVGNFSYDKDVRPHAVTEVENADGKIPGETLTTSFNDFGKIELIDDAGKNLRMDIAYGPDQQRWYSELSKNGTDIRTTVYVGGYEKVTENGKTREFYYLDGNTVAVRENGTVKTYLAFTDNLGSILSAMDENGAKVFDASYDAWGKQTVTLNTIGLHRGYTGYEMLSEFDIINMNGRLYDPVLGRFFSPDNYVQMPDNSQNFNRYSYCLNNPLKYTDPSGESIELVAFALFGMGNSMMQASYEGKSVWKAGALSLLSSAASYGIGEAFKNTAATVGNELLRAGAHGLASGVVSALGGGNFTSSFISGAAASGIGSYAQSIKMKTDLMVASTTVMGGAIAWLTGGDFLQGAIEGMNIGFFNHAAHNKDMLGKPALCKVNPDGTLVAPYDLDGVTIYYKITIPNVPIEKPLEPVYPEFDILLGIRFVVNMLSGLFTNTMPKVFSTNREFKRVYGSAGKGFEWHHIVEQRSVNVERFGAERIHNTDDIIALPTSLHRKISGFYSSKQWWTNGV